MANCIIGFPNHVDADGQFATVAFSNGSWSSSLPLTNLREPLLSKVARSTNATLASTKFDVDLGAVRTIKIISIPKSNLSSAAQVRVKAASDSLFTDIVLDTDWQDVWQEVYDLGDVGWGDAGLLDGKYSDEEAFGYAIPFLYICADDITARYWRFEISDELNVAGYVELNRLFLCSGYQPSRNMAYGAQLGWVDESTSEQSLGSARFFDERAKRRSATIQLAYLERDEALVWPFEIMRKQGRTKQVYFVFDPDDGKHLHRTAFLAYLRELSPLEYPFYNTNTVAFAFEEVIA